MSEEAVGETLADEDDFTHYFNAVGRANILIATQEEELKQLRAIAGLVTHYCAWIRWRAVNGAVGTDEIALADDLDLIITGKTPRQHSHWVRSDEESRDHVHDAIKAQEQS